MKHYCGVFGIIDYSYDHIHEVAIKSLKKLQHRGYERSWNIFSRQQYWRYNYF